MPTRKPIPVRCPATPSPGTPGNPRASLTYVFDITPDPFLDNRTSPGPIYQQLIDLPITEALAQGGAKAVPPSTPRPGRCVHFNYRFPRIASLPKLRPGQSFHPVAATLAVVMGVEGLPQWAPTKPIAYAETFARLDQPLEHAGTALQSSGLLDMYEMNWTVLLRAFGFLTPGIIVGPAKLVMLRVAAVLPVQ